MRLAKCKKRKDCKVLSRHADGQQRQEEANKTFLCNTLKRVFFYLQVTTNTSKAEQELQNLTLITNRSQLNVTILWFTVLAIFELTGLTESEPNSLATKAGQATHSLTTSRKISWNCWWQSFHFWAAVFVFSYFIAWTGKCEATQKQTTLEWRLTVTSSSTTSSVGVLRRATDVRTLSRALSISISFSLSLSEAHAQTHTHSLTPPMHRRVTDKVGLPLKRQ